MNARRKSLRIGSGFSLSAGRAQVLAVCLLSLVAFFVRAQSISSLNLPLYFEAGQDQTQFAARGNGYQFLISSAGAQLALRTPAGGIATAQMQFVGAGAHPSVCGEGELPGKINYLIGNDSSKWQTGLPTFSRVQLNEIYPGVSLVFYGNQRQLEYDFTVASGVNPDAIKIRFNGVDKVSVTPQGLLVLNLGGGEIQQSAPVIYQMEDGQRKTIHGGYRMVDARTVAFNVADYDHALPLVIDPVLVYSTFFGGAVNAEGFVVKLDPNDDIYIAGQTLAKEFASSGSVQTNFGGGLYNGDAFVAKFTNPATNLIYLTYLGGTNEDAAFGLAVDSLGNAFITGYTESTNFPTTNAMYAKIPTVFNHSYSLQPGSAFVAELNTNGSQLIYSTYLGGSSENCAEAIALDSADNAYVVGYTYSTNFPVTTNAFQKTLQSTNGTVFLNANAFVTEIPANDAGTNPIYSTYLGGTNLDVASSVAVDANNNVYVAGYTASYNFPTWNVPVNLPYGHYLNGSTNHYDYGTYDAFVAKFPPLNATISPSALTNAFYSTLLGGTNSDKAYGLAVDSTGSAYVTGWTTSTNFPTYFPNTNGPPGLTSVLATNGGYVNIITNVFLTKIGPSGSNIVYSTVFGGFGVDVGYNVAVDALGNAFVVGTATSTNFPTANSFGPLRGTNYTTKQDVFVTALNTNCSTIYYSVLMGGSINNNGYGNSAGFGITVDALDNAYITGETSATNFPTTNAPVFALIGTNKVNGAMLMGTNDAFLAEIGLGTLPVRPEITNAPTNVLVGVGATVNFSVYASGSPQLYFQWQTNGTNLVNGGRLSGVYSNTLTIVNAQTSDSGTYTVIVTNDWGTASATAVLTVLASPVIVTPPTNQTVGIGSTVTFAITANGTSPLDYQWQTNGTNLLSGAHYTGATTPTLTINDVQTNDSGEYLILVTNKYGATSNEASLTVLPAPVMTIFQTSADLTNGSLSFNVVGAVSDGYYYLLYTNNLLAPMTNWTKVGPAQFDSQGRYSFTRTFETNGPEQFYILEKQ